MIAYEVSDYGSCEGDSGGPIVRFDPETNRFQLIGIVQGGIGTCGDPSFPAIYVRIEDTEIFNFLTQGMDIASMF